MQNIGSVCRTVKCRTLICRTLFCSLPFCRTFLTKILFSCSAEHFPQLLFGSSKICVHLIMLEMFSTACCKIRVQNTLCNCRTNVKSGKTRVQNKLFCTVLICGLHAQNMYFSVQNKSPVTCTCRTCNFRNV